MKALVYLYFVESLVLYYLVTMGLFHENNPVYSAIFMSIVSFEFIYFFYKKNKKTNDFAMVWIFFLAIITRIAIINYDIYVSQIVMADSPDYREAAEIFFKTDELTFRGKKGAGLTIFLMGAIYKVLGFQKINISYTGCMCFMGAAYLTNEILKKMEIKNKYRYGCMIWMLFTPQNLLITSLSNREGYIIFLIALSIFYLFLWWEKGKFSYIVKGIVAACVGMCLHSGVVAVLVAYLIFLLFYDRKEESFCIKWNICIRFAIISAMFLLIFLKFGDSIFFKFGNIQEISDISDRAWTSVRGGSGYVLPGNGASSLGEILLYTPIRAIYFMFSPMPKYWRGIGDVIAFLICSVPHIIGGILFIKRVVYEKIKDRRRSFLIPIFLAVVACSIMFGWGVSNAGTAIRHRNKFLCLSVIVLALELDMRKDIKGNKKYDRTEEI